MKHKEKEKDGRERESFVKNKINAKHKKNKGELEK